VGKGVVEHAALIQGGLELSIILSARRPSSWMACTVSAKAVLFGAGPTIEAVQFADDPRRIMSGEADPDHSPYDEGSQWTIPMSVRF